MRSHAGAWERMIPLALWLLVVRNNTLVGIAVLLPLRFIQVTY